MDLNKVKLYETSISDKRRAILELKEELATVQNNFGITFSREVKNEYGNTITKTYKVPAHHQAVKIAKTLIADELKEQIIKSEQYLEKFIKAGVPNE